MIGAMATGTRTTTSVGVHAEEEPGLIQLGAYLIVCGARRIR